MMPSTKERTDRIIESIMMQAAEDGHAWSHEPEGLRRFITKLFTSGQVSSTPEFGEDGIDEEVVDAIMVGFNYYSRSH